MREKTGPAAPQLGVRRIKRAGSKSDCPETAADPRRDDNHAAKNRIVRGALGDHEMGPEMVIVPAGRFMMGSPENERVGGIPGAEESR